MHGVRLGISLFVLPCLAPSAGAQGPGFALHEVHRMLPPVHYTVRAAAAADMNGDGARDIVVMSGVYTSVWLDGGNGRFDVRQDTALIPSAITNKNLIAVADFDGDGDRDLAALGLAYCSTSGPTCTGGAGHLAWNDGTGRFSAVSTLAVPPDARATALAAGDVDGDGDVDLVVGCEPQTWYVFMPPFSQMYSVRGEDWVLRNNGGGQFQATPLGPELDTTKCNLLADFDGDGDLDLFVANVGQDAFFQNDGSGLFIRQPAALPVDNDWPISAEILDLESDGDRDIVLNTYEGPRLLANAGNGTFTDVTANLPSVLSGVDHLVVADFDGDGDMDIGEARLGTVIQLHNDGNGVFTHVPAADRTTPRGSAVMAIDLDRDIDVDLVRFGGAFSEHAVLLNDGSGALTLVPQDFPDALDNQIASAVADVDLDGDLDVLAPAETSPNRVYRNDGAGVFASIPFGDFTVDPGLTTDIAAGDLDGDGWTDAVLANWSFPSISNMPSHVYRNDGAGQLVRVPLPLDFAASVALGDLDGDGDLDVYLGKPQSGGPATDQVFRNNGNMVFVPISGAVTGPGATNSVALADLDGDGDLDAALCAWNSGAHRVLFNDGTGMFGAAVPLPGPTATSNDVVAADVDGDGDQDLLIANDGQPNRLCRNNGNGTFVDASADLPQDTARTMSFTAGDFDADGDVDLLECMFGGAVRSRALVNDGLGHFTVVPGGLPPMTDMAHRFAVTDFDGDADLDAFLVTQGQAHLYQNFHRQLVWRELPRIGRMLTMDVHGAPNDAYAFVASPNRVHVPIGGFGTLHVDLGALLIVEVGQLDAQGHDSRTYFVPPWPALLGVPVHWQAAHTTPTLLGNLETTTFVPN